MRQTKHIFLKLAMARPLGFLLNIFIFKQAGFIAKRLKNRCKKNAFNFKKRVVVLRIFRKAAMLRRSFHAGKIQQLCSFFEHQKKALRFVLFFIQKIKEKNTIFL